ncbi:hypothetical protein CLAFUW4_10009 [Fulvia fulva]|uniref:Uncharacterized protein n=1 Tax=Passalora fulva TaxID=5499 RepID=A0A9Q8PI68_PASFU|nr:uncharacterized protein CLAFUR5_12235 [Fulvia fulva]KAK4615692.1 hypothetical protein CLAFUR4_10013 [Fulvia fulva]KAK4617407.1 hypothetical protein CLAFUR0_10011 [Fulvia fulva]UJO22971.1 hypothetical protein CLAFUR5_12235 [Fulvia fulva]WPV18884.1 hypothetical protein CLAFUW4_10009 [Fulvia fulva]WPV34067.1 hypothetical protein CLAFUW7_10010 [Fulvia fulva]
MFALRALRLAPFRLAHRSQPLRRYATGQQPQYQAPTSASKPSPHREFYRGGLGRAVAFNFLVAMATFQVIYWGWLKLESLEVKEERTSEIERLEGEVGRLTGVKTEKER